MPVVGPVVTGNYKELQASSASALSNPADDTFTADFDTDSAVVAGWSPLHRSGYVIKARGSWDVHWKSLG